MRIRFKTLVYNIIKIPLILIFLKTPLINILKKRFKFHRFYKSKNIFWLVLDTIFQKEYFYKLKDKYKVRELTDSTLIDGEGRRWAEYYYNNHFKSLEELKKTKIGIMYADESSPLYSKIVDYIKINKIDKNEETFIIQLGSSSGRDLEFFYKLFPKLNYISTDVNNEILDFQKEKYNYPNFKFYKCYAEDIDECINHFNISDKNLILFSSKSLQYIHPSFLSVFFFKIKNYRNLNLFIEEPVFLPFIDKSNLISKMRGDTSFSHKYDVYARKVNCKIIENQTIRAYPKDNPITAHHSDHRKNTGTSFLHIKI